MVLTLKRGKAVISNPLVSRQIELGDVLLCYGKIEAMKKIIPPKVRKPRLPKLRALTDAQIKAARGGGGA